MSMMEYVKAIIAFPVKLIGQYFPDYFHLIIISLAVFGSYLLFKYSLDGNNFSRLRNYMLILVALLLFLVMELAVL